MPINMAEAYLGAQRVKQNEYAMQRDRRQDSDEAAIRAAAQGAIDPATQQYDFNRHMQNLEQAGFGERAVVLRQQAAQRLGQTVQYLDRVIPYLNESNYPKAREGLKQIGIPDELLPAQYDPAWLTEKRRQLGVDLQQLEDYTTIRKTPAGGELVGQRNPATGGYENVRELDAPRPPPQYGRGGRGAGGPPAEYRNAELFAAALGMSVGEYMIWKQRAKGADPQRLFADLLKAGMSANYGDQEAAEEFARAAMQDIAGYAPAPGPQPNPPAGRGASGSWGPPQGQQPQPQGQARPTAFNPQTNQRIEWDGRAWVPVQR